MTTKWTPEDTNVRMFTMYSNTSHTAGLTSSNWPHNNISPVDDCISSSPSIPDRPPHAVLTRTWLHPRCVESKDGSHKTKHWITCLGEIFWRSKAKYDLSLERVTQSGARYWSVTSMSARQISVHCRPDAMYSSTCAGVTWVGAAYITDVDEMNSTKDVGAAYTAGVSVMYSFKD